MDSKMVREQLETLATKAADDGQHDVVLDTLRKLSERPGVKTTEFYVSLLCGTIGGILQLVPGRELVGALLLAVATLSYNLSRGLAKMPQRVGALLFFLLVTTSGCTAQGYVKAKNVEGIVTSICDRHDAYVRSDPRYEKGGELDGQRDTDLRDSALLRKIVQEAQGEPKATTDANTKR